METLFEFDQRNHRDCQVAYRGPRNREYYLGDYTIDSGSVIDVRAERRGVGSYSIIRLRSRSRLHFRRNWTHIREDGADVAVLWFVRQGLFRVSQSGTETTATAGGFVVTHSAIPFEIECLPGTDRVHEVLHVVLPMHVLRGFLSHEIRCGYHQAQGSRALRVAERILEEVFEDGGELKDSIALQLVDTALATICDALHESGDSARQRPCVSEKRLQDVMRYVDTHLGDSKLCIGSIARGCGISPRYLSLLLKTHGTRFSDLVWEKRLQAARSWLASATGPEPSISEIAYGVGFKSAAHFSRLFKRRFKLSPSQYRDSVNASNGRAMAPVIDGGKQRH